MTLNELNNLTLATFQLKQPKKYAREYFPDDDSFGIKVAVTDQFVA